MAEHPFASPLLTVLDAQARRAVQSLSRTRRLADGGVAFAPGDPADTLWFVVEGRIALETRRGSREIGASGHFGSEALARGATRTGRAVARGDCSLLEIPVTALERILTQAGHGGLLVREGDAARRQAYAALLFETPVGQVLGEPALDVLVAQLREQWWPRGARLFEASEAARRALVVVSGLIELVDARGRRACFARGDFIGLEATLARGAYAATATALGETMVLALPHAELDALAREHPLAIARLQSVTAARLEKQARVRELSAGRTTRHAVHELGRLANARALLAIELDRCVRCGECARACGESHGTPRLTRRGEKVLLAMTDSRGLAPRALLLPEACQHCRDPACLPSCPTGAIRREPNGEVALDTELCTGCGACAKACPWDAIHLSPRPPGSANGSELVAAKCDLCRGSSGQRCVAACPTGSIFRVDPVSELVEVRSLLGGAHPLPAAPAPSRAPARRTSAPRWLLLAALAPPVAAVAPLVGRGHGARHVMASGVLAGLLALGLLLHGIVKRVPTLRSWLAVRLVPPGRGLLARLVPLHALLGAFAAAAVLAHTGLRTGHGAASLLGLTFWLLAASGTLGALAYRCLPRRLTRLEQRGTLPEDHAEERDELAQRLYAGLSERDRAVKELARRLLLPYASAWGGSLALIASGRTRAEEEARMLDRVARLLHGRKSERLSEVSGLVKAAVAVRALGARELLERALGLWVPVHLVLSLLFGLLLGVHAVGAVR